MPANDTDAMSVIVTLGPQSLVAYIPNVKDWLTLTWIHVDPFDTILGTYVHGGAATTFITNWTGTELNTVLLFVSFVKSST